MEKLERMSFARQRLCQMADFLLDYLPLANTHTVDFLVHSVWKNTIPSHIRDELLGLSHLEVIKLPYELPASWTKASDSSYFEGKAETEKKDEKWFHSNTSAAPKFTPAASSKNIDTSHKSHEMTSHVKPEVNSRLKLDRNLKATWSHRTLKDFVKAAHTNTLRGAGVVSVLTDVLTSADASSMYIKQFMNAKKAHEIHLMASVCAKLCQQCSISQVIDIGSGLGYLCGQLAFLHDLKVLGIDASNSNTHGAEKRTSRLAKQWPLLLANAQLAQKGLPPVRTKGKKKRSKKDKSDQADSGSGNHNNLEFNVKLENIIPEDYASMVTSLRSTRQLAPKGKYVPVTMFVTRQTDLLGLLNQHFGHSQENAPKTSCLDGINLDSLDKSSEVSEKCAICEENELASVDTAEKCDGQISINPRDDTGNKCCQFLNCQTQHKNGLELEEGMASLVMGYKQSDKFTVDDKMVSNNRQQFMMTGLHTCGNLASTVIKLFIANPPATTLCSVGCCYHLLEEEFVRNPFLGSDEADPMEVGFPMSKCLRERGYYLGRNARMLSSLAAARLASADDDAPGPEQALHWRALLQVILQDLKGKVSQDWNVGKIANKCTSFMEYARKALTKLEVSHELNDADFAEYESRYHDGQMLIKCFFYLRAVLSQTIESLILLDRLVYLLEQECVTEAHLLEMFDQKTSPRCYAIVARK